LVNIAKLGIFLFVKYQVQGLQKADSVVLDANELYRFPTKEPPSTRKDDYDYSDNKGSMDYTDIPTLGAYLDALWKGSPDNVLPRFRNPMNFTSVYKRLHQERERGNK
jgi:hypothetical protein